jgi:hypothetical protein
MNKLAGRNKGRCQARTGTEDGIQTRRQRGRERLPILTEAMVDGLYETPQGETVEESFNERQLQG